MADWTCPEDVPETVVERLHQWIQGGNPDDAATSQERAVVDVIRAFWPEPEPTLAEEVRAWAAVADNEMERTALNDTADRAEKVEAEVKELAESLDRRGQELATVTLDRDRLFSITQKVELERDSAIAAAKHLTAEHDRETRIIDRAEDLDALPIGAAFRVRDDVAVVSEDGRFHFPGTGLKITGGAEAFKYANYVGGTIRVLFEPAADEA